MQDVSEVGCSAVFRKLVAFCYYVLYEWRRLGSNPETSWKLDEEMQW